MPIRRTAATASSLLLKVLSQLGHAMGFDADDVFQRCAIHPCWLRLGEARLPVAYFRASWLESERRAGGWAFGIRAAELLEYGGLGRIDEALTFAPTCRHVVEQVLRYSDLLATGGHLSSSCDRDQVVVTYASPGGVPSLSDFTIALLLFRVQQRACCPVPLLRVQLTSRPPDAVARAHYERVFQCDVQYGQPKAAIVLTREALDVALDKPDHRAFCEALARLDCAYREFADFPVFESDEAWSQAIRIVTRACLEDGNPKLANVSQMLAISTRTTQRVLRRMGTSHRKLLDDVRQEVARELVARGISRHARLAQKLAYSSRRSFERVQRRWRSGAGAQH